MEYQQEFYHQVKKELPDLIKLHWEEIALNKDVIKLNPDWEAYQEGEKQNKNKCFTARHDGKLVGYFVVCVHRNLHYKDHLYATNDIIFLHPDYRKGFMGIKLIKFAEKCLKIDKISVLIINSKTHKPFDAILSRMGYSHIENVFSKRFI
jgi:GNAT superfamily N-acetyltransferase